MLFMVKEQIRNAKLFSVSIWGLQESKRLFSQRMMDMSSLMLSLIMSYIIPIRAGRNSSQPIGGKQLFQPFVPASRMPLSKVFQQMMCAD